ncbi:hypothetical protein L8C07_06300 [Paenibacillus sp. CMAA1739]|uniref:hypothetical protein n=1 Tax=Paenibacillus ottowii TaxID=2315729 RepID=UPI002DBFD39D|nr:hypothetical protein [Paenibacillus sp. CMAA1739]MEC4565552.1 hypothetical protein [Paenibacillus sp. CMAA1739]
MTFKNGQWTFNDVSDGVWGIGEYFDLKEQAIEAAKEYYSPEDQKEFYVGQICEINNSITVDSEGVLDDIASSIYDEVGEAAEDYLNHVKREEWEILNERLTQVVREWMKEFSYEPSFFRIENTEKFEIDVDLA